jgi:ribose transport system substrate-binding protein
MAERNAAAVDVRLMSSLALPLLLAASLIGGCRVDSDAGGSPPRARVGVSLLTKAHPFYRALEDGMRAAAAEAHLQLRIQSGEMDTAIQTAQIENFVVQRLDAIVLCPVDSQALGGAIRLANEAGIPVFTADIRSLQGDVRSHIASNNAEGGARVAERLARALHGEGPIAILDQPGIASVQDRVDGFERALRQYPAIRVVAKLSGGGVRDQSATTMENILQAHPEIRAVFGINDASALGALAALGARGRKDVIVVGFDADPEGRAAIRRGELLADAIQYPDRIGRTAIETVDRSLRRMPVPKEILVPTGLLDREALGDP